MKTFLLFLFLSLASQAQTFEDHCAFMSQWEWFRPSAYVISGDKTIGYGHKVPKHSNLRHVTESEARKLLVADTAAAIVAARRCVSSYDQQPAIVKKILVDLAFNLGESGLRKFRRTISACNAYEYTRMGNELTDSLWYHQTGRRARHHVAALYRLTIM